ncbi:hypothetical protein Btru_038515 [Bulinus truncatus]|nr:hypothetical protein Btru_038515 [Bulinus truncatus]
MYNSNSDDPRLMQNEFTNRATPDYTPLTKHQVQTTRRVVSFGTVLSIKGRLSAKHQRIASLIIVKARNRWRKLRMWTGIRCMLGRLHNYVTEKMTNDPSSPLYAQLTHTDKPAVQEQMLFDASDYKANRHMRTTGEVRRILTLTSEHRTEDDIYCAMIGLRSIRTIAEYPVRMQQYLAKYGTFQCYETNRTIVLQGREPEAFYFVLDGRVVVAVQDEVTGQVEVKCFLQRGHFFGELAIIKSSRRQSSVMTTCYTELLALSSDIFQQYFMVGGIKNFNDPDHKHFLGSLPFLTGWPLDLILGHTNNKKVTFGYFKRNSVMVKDSNFSDWLIIVKSGSLTVMKKLVKVQPKLTRKKDRSNSKSSRDCDILLEAVFRNCWADICRQIQPPPAALAAPSAAEGARRPRSCPASSTTTNTVNNQPSYRKILTPFGKHPDAQCENSSKHPKGGPSPRDPSQDVPTAEEQITFLDYLDSTHGTKKPHITSEADLNPQFVIVQILTKGSVFGLAQCLFTDQPSLSVVSNGADCILMDKKFFLSNCSNGMMRRLRQEVSIYAFSISEVGIGAVSVGEVAIGAVRVCEVNIGAVSVGAVSVGAVSVGEVGIGAVSVSEANTCIGAVSVGEVNNGAVSVGDVSVGAVNVGAVSVGEVNNGAVSVGVVSAAAVSAGAVSVDEVNIGVVSVGDVSVGDVSVGAVSVDDVSVGAVSVGAVSVGDVSVGVVSAGAVSAGAVSVGEVNIGVVSVGDVSVGDVSVGEVNIGAVSVGEVNIGAVSVGEVNIGAVSVGEVNIGAVSVGEVNIGAVSAGAVSVGEVNIGVVSVGEVNIGAVSVGDVSVGVVSVGDVSVGVVSVGDVSVGDVSVGDVRVGAVSVGAVSVDEVNNGAVSVGVVSAGAVSAGAVSVGEVNIGVVSVGDVSVGDVSVGEVNIGFFNIGAVSVGAVSVGEVNIGAVSAGAVSVGEVNIGVVSVGDVSVGEVNIGAVSVGEVNIGAVSVGEVNIGAVSVGEVNIGAVSVGEVNIGAVSVGEVNNGALSVGEVNIGAVCW